MGSKMGYVNPRKYAKVAIELCEDHTRNSNIYPKVSKQAFNNI